MSLYCHEQCGPPNGFFELDWTPRQFLSCIFGTLERLSYEGASRKSRKNVVGHFCPTTGILPSAA